MFDYAAQAEWPFAVVALSAEARGGIVEPTFEHARRRMARLLHQAGAGDLARELPPSRTPFVIENKDSCGFHLHGFDLTIALAWVRLRSSDADWPAPVLVAALGRGSDIVLPTLAPDRDRSRAWAARLRHRGLSPTQILELPVTDRRDVGTQGRDVATFRDVLDHRSVVEEVVRVTIAPRTAVA